MRNLKRLLSLLLVLAMVLGLFPVFAAAAEMKGNEKPEGKESGR